ncbi:5'-nucleotidase C-terminal domain-containing protein [Mycoplasmatota bacterium]|nr:5'-nucleotidase C-terminal domain-containing protein [Mycoplasmatota bacterium]
MKKLLSILLLIFIVFGIAGCNDVSTLPNEDTNIEDLITEEVTTENSTSEPSESTLPEDGLVKINLFSINDFHGGAYTDIDLISGIGAYIKSFEGHKIAVSNGDILQGSSISNYYHGRIFVDIFNEIGFKGFVIGNHEFDWGIEKIGEYKDGNMDNGELNHPVLAANIVYEDSQEPLEFSQPYFIEEFDGVRVGVIGMIGQISDSIAASRTENIEFLDPVLTAGKYAKELREEKDVDIVVVYIHDSSWNNRDFSLLNGNQRIDAMFNGHSHQNEAEKIFRLGDTISMPYAQMNNFTTSLASIQLTYDLNTGALVDKVKDELTGKTEYLTKVGGVETTYLQTLEDDRINEIISTYKSNQEYNDFISEVLTISDGYYDKATLSQWGASVIRDYAGVDIGALNTGGFRVSIESGDITMGDLITIYPFDNVIKTSEMTGQKILDFYTEIIKYGEDVVFDDGLYYNDHTNKLEINGSPIILDKYYTVGAVDYIFDKNDYDFIEGKNITQTIYYMRDLIVKDLRDEDSLFDSIGLD